MHVKDPVVHVRVGGLWKHKNNQHALVPPRRWNVAAQEAEELKTGTFANT